MKAFEAIVLSRRELLSLLGLAVGSAGISALAQGKGLDGAASHPQPQTGVEDLETLAPLGSFLESYAPTGLNVGVNRKIRLVFTPSSLTGDSIDPGSLKVLMNGQAISLTPYYTQAHGNREFRCVPFPFWQPGKQYSVLVQAGVNYLKSGEELEDDVSWTFQTDPETVDELYSALTTRPLDASELEAAHAGLSDKFQQSNLVKDWQVADSSLYDVSESIDPYDLEVQALSDKMINSLTSLGAIGLAAPQFGINRRLFVAQVGGKRQGFLNPRVESWSQELYYGSVEGCLSIDYVRAKVGRPKSIQVSYNTPGGARVTSTYQNDDAKVWLHEYDHLNGILIVDRQQEKRYDFLSNTRQTGLIPFTPAG